MIADTPDESRYWAHLARLTPAQRFAIQVRLVRDGRALARTGIRRRHPDASPQEVEIRLAAMLYGREAAAILGPVPDDAVELVDVRTP